MHSFNTMTTRTVADENEDFAVRQRLDTFRLGKSIPPSQSFGAPDVPKPNHRHQRSHSRNPSISSSSSFSLSSLASSRSSGLTDFATISFGGIKSSESNSSCASTTSTISSSSSSASVVAPPPPSSKRNSHHRRRSSVSTRHESAEMMGVSLPELPLSFDHNVNFGDKDSIRRRALWALEGKPDMSFTKVEIPELSTLDIEKAMYDFSTKSSFTGGTSVSFGSSGSKRDSFKLLPCSGSSKDQLHTLVEEEEEEEEVVVKQDTHDALPSPVSADEDSLIAAPMELSSASLPVSKLVLGKPRPANLNLRPLSLVAEVSTGLPTPSLTPSPRSGLRSLSLSPASSGDEATKEMKQSRRNSLNFMTVARRPALNVKISSVDSTTSSGDEGKPIRRSSISYKSSSHNHTNSVGLPTPEMTPTFGRRHSLAESNKSGEEEFFLGPQQPSCKPLSASEQHFLLKSHNALVARITDLERALSKRVSMADSTSSSRPNSIVSGTTSPSDRASISSVPGEPSDEMLFFIRDLKAERDELKKDVDGWRTRVNDLDRKHALLAKRVETERWEAWAARARVGVLETEKVVLEKRVEALDRSFAELCVEKDDLESLNRQLKVENEEKTKRVQVLEAELKQVKEELERERRLRQQEAVAVRSSSLDGDLLDTPTPEVFQAQRNSYDIAVNLGLDLSDDHAPFLFGVDPMTEVDEDSYSDDENNLAGYEDEDDGEYDETFESSSVESLDEYPNQTTSHWTRDNDAAQGSSRFSNSGDVPPLVPARPAEPLRDSLPFNWSFPRAQQAQAAKSGTSHHHQQSVDRFFNCLDQSDASDDSAPASPASFNYEQSKDMFASGFRFASEEAPFFFPSGVGTIIEEPEIDMDLKGNQLQTVQEDIEEDDDVFGDIGGIRITFTPPDDSEAVVEELTQIQVSPIRNASIPPVLPDFNFGHADENDNGGEFMFGISTSEPLPAAQEPCQPLVYTPAAEPPSITVTPPSSLPRLSSPKSPSSIPRPISHLSSTKCTESASRSHSPKASPALKDAYATPPTKRGGAIPSFIPQPVNSPSPVRTVSSLKSKTVISGPTFIRPPTRKPALSRGVTQCANGSTFNPQPAPTQHKPMMDPASLYSVYDLQFQSPMGTKPEQVSQVTMKSVDLRQDPSVVSILQVEDGNPFSTASPSRLASFITTPLSAGILANVLPWSWSSRSVSTQPSTTTIPALTRKTSYVSKEKQLAKLKFRLEHDNEHVGGVLFHCRLCDQNPLVML